MRRPTAKTGSIGVAVVAVGVALALLWPGSTAKAPRSALNLDGAWIVLLRGSADDTDTTTNGLQRRHGFAARHRFRRAVKGFSARLNDRQAARLREEPEVVSVTRDRPVEAFAEVDLAANESIPPGVRRIGAGARAKAREASTAPVAVIDSGVDLAHPDLDAAHGVNCVAPGTPAEDDDGHGTHVAGTIAARNDGRGVVGVAPGTKIYAVKVLDADGQGSVSQLLCGIDWVTGTRADADPRNDIGVANLSLGGTGPPVRGCAVTLDPLHRAVCASTRAGVTYVVAAGNDGRSFDDAAMPDLPAAYPEVLAVTAMSDSDGAPGAAGGPPTCRSGERDDRFATFSNFAATTAGAAHTVAAPGACIRSTWRHGGYATISGTSMAAPHLAGAAALCLGEARARGPCSGLSAAAIVARMRDEASRHALEAPGSGFAGDPACAVARGYLGFLGWAGLAGGAAAAESSAAEPAACAAQDPPAGTTTARPPPGGTTPPPVRPPAPADRTPPAASVSVPRQRLVRVLRRGLRVDLRCSEGCIAAMEVLLPGRTAKRLRLSRGRTARIARRSSVRLAAGTRRSVALRLSRSSRRRLARLRRVVLTVRVSARDAAGNRRVTSRRAVVRR